MNLSETAFATIDTDGSETFEKSTKFGLRWFTPSHEVDLCGHVGLIQMTCTLYICYMDYILQATLATAAVIFHKLGKSLYNLFFIKESASLH